ncbi:MAG: hypothetical protein Kow0042_13270 [Calditrichia bacterium]
MTGDKNTRRLYAYLADFLEYPTVEIFHKARIFSPHQSSLPHAAQEHLQKFFAQLKTHTLQELEEIYTRTFDLQMVCYPYVGYHLFGESYKRGAFLAELKARFTKYQFSEGNELPDHLAVLLRFLSIFSDEEERMALIEDALIPALTPMLKPFVSESDLYKFLLTAILIILKAEIRDEHQTVFPEKDQGAIDASPLADSMET